MELSFIEHALTNAALQVFEETKAKAFSVPVPGTSPSVLVTAGEREECMRLLMAGWLPSAESINALPQPLRSYIHDLETRCDPAGDVAALAITREQVRQLSEITKGLRALSLACRECNAKQLSLFELAARG